MATTVMNHSTSALAGDVRSGARSRSFLGLIATFFEAMADARRMRAETYVRGYLGHLSDEELARIGWTRAEMVRHTRSLMNQG